MRYIYFLLFLYILFVIEFLLFNVLSPWLRINLVFLFVIYCQMIFSQRNGYLIAAAAGILKDSYAASFFGFHTISFLFSCYIIAQLKKILFFMGSERSRFVIVVVGVLSNTLFEYFLFSVIQRSPVLPMVPLITFTEVFLTILLANQIFRWFQVCASKSFAS